jgi:hypothetical protein
MVNITVYFSAVVTLISHINISLSTAISARMTERTIFLNVKSSTFRAQICSKRY